MRRLLLSLIVAQIFNCTAIAEPHEGKIIYKKELPLQYNDYAPVSNSLKKLNLSEIKFINILEIPYATFAIKESDYFLNLSPDIQTLRLTAQKEAIHTKKLAIGQGKKENAIVELHLVDQTNWNPLTFFGRLNPFNRSSLTIGVNQNALVSVEDKSRLYSTNLTLGELKQGKGLLQVKDVDSTVETGTVYLGGDGIGTLEIFSSGFLKAKQIKMALGEGIHKNTALASLEHRPTGKIAVSGKGSHLEVSDTIFLANNGTAYLEAQNGGTLTTKNLFESSTATPHSLNLISLTNDATLEVQKTMNLGTETVFDISISDHSKLKADTVMLSTPGNSYSPFSRVTLNKTSRADIKNSLFLNAPSGLLYVILEKNSQMHSPSLFVGGTGSGQTKLELYSNSQFYGNYANIGGSNLNSSSDTLLKSINNQAELVIGTGSCFNLNDKLYITPNEHTQAAVILQTSRLQDKNRGPQLIARAIHMGHLTQAQIIVDNNQHDTSAAEIQADITGYGSIKKLGTGSLNLIGKQLWEGMFEIINGEVHLSEGSSLSPNSYVTVHKAAKLQSSSLNQSVQSLVNYGTVNLSSSQANTTFSIHNNLLGKGEFILGASFNTSAADQIKIDGTAYGEHLLSFNFRKEKFPDPEKNRLLIVTAKQISNIDPLFLLKPNTPHKPESYHDFGMYRYDLTLEKVTDLDGDTEWYLQRTKRAIPKEKSVRLNNENLSILVQHMAQKSSKIRKIQKIITQGSLILKEIRKNKAELRPIVTLTDVLPYQTISATQTLDKTFGLSYQMPYAQSFYTIEAFQTTNAPSHSHSKAVVQTQAFRTKWQHTSGWQAFIGVEKSNYQENSLPSHTSSLTSTGVAYQWNLASQWSHGPQIQYSQWNAKSSPIGWDDFSESTVYATPKNTNELQLGWQVHYTSPSEQKSNIEFTAGGFWKQHQETLSLHTKLQRLDLPMNYQAQTLQAQMVWKPSQNATWRIAAESTFQTGKANTNMLQAEWNHRF